MPARQDKRDLFYHDRLWLRAWSGATSEFMQDAYLDIDQRAGFLQFAYSSAPAMVRRSFKSGSKYPFTYRDASGALLSGER